MKPGNGLAYRHAFSPQKPAVNEPLAEYMAESHSSLQIDHFLQGTEEYN